MTSDPLFPGRGQATVPGGALRVLLVEDSVADVELCVHELRRAGFELELDVAPTRETYETLLASGKTYDIVLSDYRLPAWTGMDALERLRAVDHEVPFVLVTGSLGDESAVECIKRGAADYVLKENLARLPVSVRRALTERRLHDERRRQEEEKEALQRQLLHSQKMEAVGRLAGGIAHDFNNLLTAILGYGELLAGELGESDDRIERVEEILKATQKAAGLTRQLLAFSRRQVLQPRVVELNAIVSEMEKMLRRLIGEQIVLETRLDPMLGAVRADPGQIEQVILNLVLNARDAMPEGGRIALETRNQDVDSDDDAVPAGSYVVLEVSDSGQGMEPEVLAHIFEPFFTTKELGRGTGLGLSTVYGIVSQHHGHIIVESRPGDHSRFTVFLPRVERLAAVDKAAAPAAATGGSETVLVVEDDAGVRGLVEDLLSLGGYEVLAAATAAEALRVCGDRRGEVDLILLDLVLPDMRGDALRKSLAEAAPGARMLVMSGYAGNDTSEEPLEEGTPFLQKPFSATLLARKVREVLGSRE